jgi:hypothetical protein
METVRHLSIEQTALANLIYRLAPDFYGAHYRARTLDLGQQTSVSVMSLPMKQYNFTKIDAATAELTERVAVAHFTGGKKQQQHWDWVSRLIARELGPPALPGEAQ